MTDPAARPPRWAERLLAACVAPGLAREGLLGDLAEEHADRADRSPRRAALWYWRAALAAAPRLAWHHRVTHRAAATVAPAPGDPLMATLLHDLRFAGRTLRLDAGVTLVAALALAIGIGANATIFGVADAFLLRPLPFAEPGRLVHVWGTDRARGDDKLRVSLPTYRDWQASGAFSELALFNYTTADLAGGDEAVRVSLGRVSANAFRLLGVRPQAGRTFADGEDRPGHDGVAVISDAFWRRQFGGRRDALGATVRLGDRPYTVVGVMPPGFAFPLNITEVWAPYALDAATYGRDHRTFQVVGRLAPGVTRARAQALLDARSRVLEREHPDTERGRGASVVPLREALNFAYDVLAPMTLFLTAAGALVLLLACANVASILLARATARGREIAVRVALGAGRGRVVRQLLTESVLLALLGGAVGVALAALGMRAIERAIPPDIYRAGPVGLGPTVLGYTLALSLFAATAFGLAPAAHATRGGLHARLRHGGRAGTAGGGARRRQGALIVAQVALTLSLLVGATLVGRSLLALRRADPGFEPRGVYTALVALSRDRYGDRERLHALHGRILEAAHADAAVRAAALVDFLPLNHETNTQDLARDAAPPPEGTAPPRASVVSVTPRYFDVMRLPLLRGRAFADADRADAAPVVVVNAALQRRLWPEARGDAVGRTLFLVDGRERTAATVVGVVADARHASLHGAPEPQLYVPQAQRPTRYFRLLLRGDADDAALAAAARRAVAAADRQVAVSELRPLRAVVDEFLLPQRGLSGVLAVLASGALLLALVGVYGVMSYAVSQRTREIGVRVALGASPRRVLALVLARAAALTLGGIALGLGGALALSRLLGGLLVGVSRTDPVTYVGIPLALAAVSLLACAVPLRRALRVDPVVALREE